MRSQQQNPPDPGGGAAEIPTQDLSPGRTLTRVFLALFVPAAIFAVLFAGFLFLRDTRASQLIVTIIAIVWGVVGVGALYWSFNWFVTQLPERWQSRVEPLMFIGPAMVFVAWYMAFPAVRTFYLSFFGRDSELFVGLANYEFVFFSRAMFIAFRNNLMWIIFATGLSVFFGFIIAYVADRTSWERIGKVFIFLPMAISMVGASVIWRFVYSINPDIGLLNAIVTNLGAAPQPWLTMRPENNFFVMVVFIWAQTGFAMIVLSAAIKGVPKDLLDQARVDGANEPMVLVRIIIPYVKMTIVAVSTAITIATLKTFDVVFAMTQGLDGTEVLATMQYKQMFRYFHWGRAAAVAIIIMVIVIPVVIYNVVQYRKEGAL